MREPRGHLEMRLESVARARRREQEPELRKVSCRELKNELERIQAAGTQNIESGELERMRRMTRNHEVYSLYRIDGIWKILKRMKSEYPDSRELDTEKLKRSRREKG